MSIAAPAHPDVSQFDPKSPYYDPKSKRDTPRWVNVDVKLVEKTRLVPLTELRAHPAIAEW